MTLPSFSAATALQAEPSAPRVRLSEHVGQPGSAFANPFVASGCGVGDGFTGPGEMLLRHLAEPARHLCRFRDRRRDALGVVIEVPRAHGRDGVASDVSLAQRRNRVESRFSIGRRRQRARYRNSG